MTAPDTLPRELAELGELLREDPPRPEAGWVRDLDARAAAGFPRPPRRTLRSRLPRLHVPMPAVGLACSVLILAVVGYAVLRPSDGSGGSSTGSSGASSQAASGSAGSGDTTATSPGAGASGESSSGSGAVTLSPRAKSAPVPSGGDSSPATSTIAPVPPAPSPADPGSDARRARLQERSAALTLAAPRRDVETIADGVVRVTDSAGGFVATSDVNAGRNASFALRVPSARLQDTLARLSRLAHVRARTQSTLDITARAVSLAGRLKELRNERTGLLRALTRATTLTETARIRARLRTVNGQIATAQRASRRVHNRASYASVAVTIVGERTAAAAPADNGRWTPSGALHVALRVLEVAASVLLVALAVALPVALLLLLAWLAARATRRHRRERALDMA
ncbi:MAG: hypothetical protein QOE28_1312, partial [Solirubrobacteraceae bacterium]|nr:hypothetical protein [Solirubrobacteraceae bacterium]